MLKDTPTGYKKQCYCGHWQKWMQKLTSSLSDFQIMTSHHQLDFNDDPTFQHVLKYIQDMKIDVEEDLFAPTLFVPSDLDVNKITSFCYSRDIKVLITPGWVSVW